MSSSNLSVYFDVCHNSTEVPLNIYTAYFIGYVLLVPLFVFVLYVGYRRWRKRSCGATAAMTSHSDIITFNMVVLELISFLGHCFHTYGVYAARPIMSTIGMSLFSIISPGQILFHLFTCVERYLAVVHPVTYLGLRRGGGARIRNVSIGCVWLLCFLSPGLSEHRSVNIIYNLMLGACSSVVISLCSLSVLCVLIRPGPGEEGGNRERVDQSKARVVYIVSVITGIVLVKLLGTVVSYVMYSTHLEDQCDYYLIGSLISWLSLPSSLVLPLLFLHRAGRLAGCKRHQVPHSSS